MLNFNLFYRNRFRFSEIVFDFELFNIKSVFFHNIKKIFIIIILFTIFH